MSVNEESRIKAEAEIVALYEELHELEQKNKYSKEEWKSLMRKYALKVDDVREKYGFPRIEG